MNEPRNILDMLQNSAKNYGNRIALSEFENGELIEISFAKLNDLARRQCIFLKMHGGKPGSNIAISGPNSIDWVIRFFSIIYAGCTVVPIDPKLNAKSVEFILGFTNCSSFFIDDPSKVHQKYRDITSTIKVGWEPDRPSMVLQLEDIREETGESLIKKYDFDYGNPVQITEDSIAEILFTSGTTGDPKGVMLSHKNLMSNVIDIKKIVSYDDKETSFSILPLHHVYELTGGLLNNIYNGNTVHFCSKIDLPTMSKEMKIVQPSIWPVVPLILEKIYKGIKKSLEESLVRRALFYVAPKLFGKLVKHKIGLDKIKFILCGGAALNEEIERFLDKIGVKIVQGYGLSEASPLISVNPPTKVKFGSVGKIIKSCSVELRDKNDEGHGIIFAKGPNIFLGYYKNPESTNDVLKDGWLDTGDIGYLDDEDYLYITGREKFVIVNKGGKNIYPEEIEEHLKTSNLVKDSVVFSSDDKNIIVIIQPEELVFKNRHLDEVKKIIYDCVLDTNKQLESYKRINKVYITTNDFKKTSTQKIKRDFLRDFKSTDYILAN
ncbi:MAG TPA: hypothetical protein EYO89_04800 [Candidatus Dadabacteria bacterium]|nr:hypothetical protein [Candidatus Dadabacteria bacterium]